MPRRCCISNCYSNYNPNTYVNVFCFPRNPVVRQKWVEAIPGGDKLNVTNFTVVCKYHFDPDDIISEELREDSEGVITPVKRKHPKLKKGTLPSIFTLISEEQKAMSGSTRTRNAAKEQKKAASDVSSSSSANESSESDSDTDSDVNSRLAGGGKSISSAKVVIRPCDFCKKVKPNVLSFKDQRFCSYKCYSYIINRKQMKSSTPSPGKAAKKASPANGVSTPSPSPSPSTPVTPNPEAATKSKTDNIGSFDWSPYLNRPDFVAAPVSCFKHVALSDSWKSIIVGMKVETVNRDSKNYGSMLPTFYWIASVVKIAGYMALLRYEGFDDDDSRDFWVNMCTDDLHPIGWCSSKGKPLIPPKSIEQKYGDWKQFLVKRLVGSKTLPSDFAFKVEESMNTNIQKGMRLEVVDKNRISAVRVAYVNEVVGGRLHVTYEGCEEEDEGFWCHERSPLIHPVGWAQVIGHDLKATTEYAKQSLQKTLYREFEPNDATWDMFLPVLNPVTDLKFKVGMKLEAIDPLNLSTICVATVTKVLRNNYLMIGIDGMMAANGSDWFCYHASSPCIFPVGFCESNNITLTPPRGYKGEFKWGEYLKQTKSSAAPVGLFKKDIPDHGFKEGMHLEAVDLMEPRLICVGSVTKVVGRLLCIHFDGWDAAYDQWCDCESPDLFPVGWCQVVGYRLEPPRTEEETGKKKKKFTIYKGQRKKKKGVPSARKSLFQNTASAPVTRSSKDKAKEESGAPAEGTRRRSSEGLETAADGDKKTSNSESAAVSGPAALKSPLTETDPSKWTVADVAQFLAVNECGSYSQIFSQEKINGAAFLALTKEKLMSLTGMKFGPSLKISHLIQQLKANKK